MRFTTEYAKRFGDAVIKTKIGLSYSDPTASCSLVGPDTYREFIKPYHKELVDYFKAKRVNVTVHICGTTQRFQLAHGLASAPRPEVRILIVDDEADLVDMLVEYLADDPRAFKLETATDGYEALIKVGGFKPTILILDVLMPRLDGIEVCRRLKANPETRAIGILGITGHPDSIPALVDAGAQACLAKPLQLGELRRELDRLLASMES